MPIKQGIQKVMIIGSGPIVIGQACEFDYSGVQACKALMSLGLEVILVNSNPATIMTDPDTATKVYVEPLQFDYVKTRSYRMQRWRYQRPRQKICKAHLNDETMCQSFFT